MPAPPSFATRVLATPPWVVWGLAFALVVFLGARISLYAGHEGDLRPFYDAASRLNEGLDLYQRTEGPNPKEPTGYLYLPPFALLFWPLTALPFGVVRFVWYVLCGALALRTYATGWRLLAPTRGPPGARLLVLAIGVAVSSRYVLSDLNHGQANLVSVGLAIEGVWQIHRGRFKRGTLVLALGTVFKLVPALLVLGYFLRKRWKTGAVTAAWGLLLVMLSAPALALLGYPWSTLPDYLWRFLTEITVHNRNHQIPMPTNSAITAWLTHMLSGAAKPDQPLSPLWGTYPIEVAYRWGTVVSTVCFSGWALWAWRAPAAADVRWRTATLLAAIPWITPVATKPHLSCLLLPLLAASRVAVLGGRGRIPAILALMALGLTSKGVIGKMPSIYWSIYGGVTLGVVLLGIALALENPEDAAADPAQAEVNPAPTEEGEPNR